MCLCIPAWETEQDPVSKERDRGRAQWLTPVVPALWETMRADCLRSGDRDQPDQHDETKIPTKNTKISQVWRWVPVIPATQEAEAGESLEPRRQVAVSRDGATAVQPGDRARLHLLKKKGKYTHNYVSKISVDII